MSDLVALDKYYRVKSIKLMMQILLPFVQEMHVNMLDIGYTIGLIVPPPVIIMKVFAICLIVRRIRYNHAHYHRCNDCE